jgi:hypothetical protein
LRAGDGDADESIELLPVEDDAAGDGAACALCGVRNVIKWPVSKEGRTIFLLMIAILIAQIQNSSAKRESKGRLLKDCAVASAVRCLTGARAAGKLRWKRSALTLVLHSGFAEHFYC